MIRCSTWNIMKITRLGMIFIILWAFLAISCQKGDATPELSDEIYKDLVQELSISKKNIAAEEEQLAKVRADLKLVVPQTGQIQYAQLRVNESSANLERYKQQAKYFEIKIEHRKAFVRQRYLESRRPGGKPWPDAEETKDYKLRLKLQQDALGSAGKTKKDPTSSSAPDVPRGTEKH